VICGVRKCGTTALFRWLGQHPDVCPSSAKETRFLMDRDSPYYDPARGFHDVGIEGYESYFTAWRGEPFRVEATSRYYDQDTALDVLSSLASPPHAVIVLRDPVDRLVSAFEYAKNNRSTIRSDVSLEDFVDAASQGDVSELLSASQDSRFGREHRMEVSQLAKELDYGCYIQRLADWQARYPEGRLHVLLFEDLRRNPRAFVQGLARRIGLAPSFYDESSFRRENQTVTVRSHRVHSVVRRLAPAVPRTAWTRSVYRWYLKMQQRRRAGSAVRASARERLAAHYAEANRELAERFGLDLSEWPSARVHAGR